MYPGGGRAGEGTAIDLDLVLIVASGPAAVEDSDELIEVGCSQICANTNEARRAVRNFILQRAKARSRFGRSLPRRYARGNN